MTTTLRILSLLVIFCTSQGAESKPIFQNGYYFSFRTEQVPESTILLGYEVWHFNSDSLHIDHYHRGLDSVYISKSYSWNERDGQLNIKHPDWNGESIQYPIQQKWDAIILEDKDLRHHSYLLYAGTNAYISNEFHYLQLNGKSYSIEKPEYFFKAHEVEFWEYGAYFFNQKEDLQCSHTYTSKKIGEREFLFFNHLDLAVITAINEEEITYLSFKNGFHKGTMKRKYYNYTNSDTDFKGHWSCKVVESIDDGFRLKEYPSIPIGYNVIDCIIDKHGYISWPKNQMISFQSEKKKDAPEPEEVPEEYLTITEKTLKISPSRKLVSIPIYQVYDHYEFGAHQSSSVEVFYRKMENEYYILLMLTDNYEHVIFQKIGE